MVACTVGLSHNSQQMGQITAWMPTGSAQLIRPVSLAKCFFLLGYLGTLQKARPANMTEQEAYSH
jgi:hypothetical protein